MTVHEIMTAGVECVRPGDTARDAARKMRDLEVGSLPVCGEDGNLCGMVTDRDIAIRAVADGADANACQVGDIMSPHVFTCREEDDVAEAARLMEEHQIRRLIVLNSQQRLVGILSLGDMAVKSGDDRINAEALQQISEPAMPSRQFARH